ncbi:glycosyltransferase [Salicola sp. Rm-C-2C1-2]|uniref:glycosyltransferase n=1 Tax=Salicola sp. Rm-C-2C1-2 TaxID=3141321 RepID=UPI0032E46E1C
MPFSLHALVAFAVTSLFAVAIAGSLIVDSLLSGATYGVALAGLGFIVIARLRGGRALPPADREIKLIGFALAFFALVSLATWALNGFGYEDFKNLGKHGRLLLFWPLLVALAHSGLRERPAFLGLAACASLSGLVSLEPLLWGETVHRANGGTNAIPFGNLALLSGLMLLSMAGPLFSNRRYPPCLLALLAGALGLAAAYLSGTRNNLLALPVLILFLVLVAGPRQRVLSAVVGVLVLGLFVGLESRLGQGVLSLLNGNYGRGIEYRFDVWQHALGLFTSSPLTGVGVEGYAQALQSGIEAGELPQGLARCCLDHAHNDLLQILATRGLAGALSWLLLLAIPFAQFLRYTRHESARVAALARAGALVPLAYLVFGLTEAALERGIYITFYLLTVTTLTHLLFRALDESLTCTRGQRLSATVITYNEADNIGRCLESLKGLADEIIVVDSGSTDDTVAIARQYTDRITVTDWPGFGTQKQRALEQATGEWVLSIDADERITPYLAREINHRLAGEPNADAFKLRWAVTIYGKRLDFGRSARAPLRLFRREGAAFSSARVHEAILLPDGARIRTLRGRLTHYTHRDYGHALSKSAQYAWLSAQQKAAKGQRTRTLLYPSLRAITTFVQVYILRLGFLDGPVGYLMAVTYAQTSFTTYAGLWTMQRQSHSTHS